MRQTGYAKQRRLSAVEPYASRISILEKYLASHKIVVNRSIRFERTDLQTILKHISHHQLTINLDTNLPKMTISFGSATSKPKWVFDNYERALLWLYRRIETAHAVMKTVSIDDQPYYQTIIEQLDTIASMLVTASSVTFD